jgi:uncharacterized protein (TIGR03083 family)
VSGRGFDWADVVEGEGRALADAVARDPSAAVPSAPEWDTTALLRHVGEMQGRAATVLRTGTQERPTVENGMLDPPPPDGDVPAWFDATLAELVAQIRAIEDPDRPVYAFSPQNRRAGFWPRRMAHETTIHRVDAEQAVGTPVAPIDPSFAVDGIAELLTIFVPFVGARSPGDGRSVHLHATDADGEWLLRFDEGAVSVEARHAKGDAAVRGPAPSLLLWLWGRVALDELEVLGDRAAADALREVATI